MENLNGGGGMTGASGHRGIRFRQGKEVQLRNVWKGGTSLPPPAPPEFRALHLGDHDKSPLLPCSLMLLTGSGNLCTQMMDWHRYTTTNGPAVVGLSGMAATFIPYTNRVLPRSSLGLLRVFHPWA